MEFCDRALHVDGKCVKAFSRRASAFVRLAVECSVSLEATTALASAADENAGSSTVADSTNDEGKTIQGRADVSADLALEETEAGAGESRICHERFGGREGLMALALLDLDAAVELVPDGEDVKRQRDALRQEIDEAKVCYHHVVTMRFSARDIAVWVLLCPVVSQICRVGIVSLPRTPEQRQSHLQCLCHSPQWSCSGCPKFFAAI